jgi:hypothetical protein
MIEQIEFQLLVTASLCRVHSFLGKNYWILVAATNCNNEA